MITKNEVLKVQEAWGAGIVKSGSLKDNRAGVWQSSMPYEKRIQYVAFIENQKHIESGWDKTFGDRKNEIVFIGQDIDEERIKKDLESCLLTKNELNEGSWKIGYDYEWPVQRAYVVD